MNPGWFQDAWWLAVAILTPLGLAALLGVKCLRGAVAACAPLAAVPALGVVFWGPSEMVLTLPWMLQGSMLVLDETARVFLGFTSALYLAAAWYARAYLAADNAATRFFVLLFAAMTGNFALILAGDVAAFYCGFALMGLASAGLVLHRGDPESQRAGRIYLALAMVGEVLIFAGFTFLVAGNDTLEIAALHQAAPSLPALALVLTGFGIKAGMLTLHFWLPLAHPAAPVPASAVLSGAMIKAGLLGWLRFLPLGEAAMPTIGYGYMIAGLAAAGLGTVVGVVQTNPKTVLAYSSISQMGIIMTGLGIGALQPAAWPGIELAVLIYATHHALAKGALFLGVGPAHLTRTRGQRILARTGLLLPALALAGAPFTSGALAKVALKGEIDLAAAPGVEALSWLLPLAAVGTTLKMARFLWLTWPRSNASVGHGAPVGLWAPWLALVLAVCVGIWALPMATEWFPVKFGWAKLWGATWPLIAGSALALLGAWLRRGMNSDLSRWLPAGDMGVILERAAVRLLPDGRGASTTSGTPHGPEVEPTDTGGSTVRWAGLAVGLSGIEAKMRSWPVAGLALAAALGWLLWLLRSQG